jgi:paired amphipathic helix protein Sin3a
MPPPLQVPSTAATPDDLQMFERIRKEMANKTQFSEFIKLLNLFNQDLITGSYCLFRAKQFLDPTGASFGWLKTLLGNPSDEGTVRNNPRPGAGNTRVSLSKCRSMGPSYRLLPKHEQNQLCSGRDELCRSVLNDEWVSHPTWESEEAGFVAHKKTQWEEALHRIEEERHDYDTSIEAVSRTIQLLEPYVVSIDGGRPPEAVDSKLGGQSEFIYKRAIYKVYGRETGHVIIERLFTAPSVVIPTLYYRLKDVREKWKASQRQWNEIWRQQMHANFDKSLDPQGSGAKGNIDKRQFLSKALHNEAKAKSESKGGKARIPSLGQLDSNSSLVRGDYQFAYEFNNEQVLSDTLRLILAQIQSKSEDTVLITRTEEFFNIFLGKGADANIEVDLNDEDVPAQSIEVQPRGKTRKSKPLSRAVFNKGKGNGSGSGSRGNTPVAESVLEEEAAENDQDQSTPVLRNWFNPTMVHPNDSSSHPASLVATPGEDVSMADSGEKDAATVEESERKEFNMYCNGNLYCFMRLFGTLYERLCLIYDAERQVRDIVEAQNVHKPAHELNWITRRPSDHWDLEAIKNGGTFYQQVVDRFMRYIQQPTEAVSLQDIEDMLRQYYLFCGYKLYHFDRLLGQMDRLAALMFSNEKDKATEQLIQLFKKDRVKSFATAQDELQYRKQAARYLGPKDKSDDPAYRITYVSSTDSYAAQMMIYASVHYDTNPNRCSEQVTDIDFTIS